METRNPEITGETPPTESGFESGQDGRSLPVNSDEFLRFDGETGAFRSPSTPTIDDPELEARQSADLARWAETRDEAVSVSDAGSIAVINAGVTGFVELHPIAAMFCAAGVGLVIGRLITSR